MAAKIVVPDKFPDVQACLSDVRAFLNALEKTGPKLTRPLRGLMLKAHFGCNYMIEIFDPERRYQIVSACVGELPRRPRPIEGISVAKVEDPLRKAPRRIR